MITEIKSTIMPDGTRLSEFRGLSDDTKPTEYAGKSLCNGSSFLEMDTGFTSYFDATPSTGGWTEAPATTVEETTPGGEE